MNEATLRVRYAETDQMGVVHHANYITWLEIGRTDLLRQLGFSYVEMEADGMALPVVDVKCRYRLSAHYDDDVIIQTWLEYLRDSLMRFRYKLVRKNDGQLLAEAESTHIVVGRDMKRTPLTPKYLAPLRAAAENARAATKS